MFQADTVASGGISAIAALAASWSGLGVAQSLANGDATLKPSAATMEMTTTDSSRRPSL